jgi:hypothetical protein
MPTVEFIVETKKRLVDELAGKSLDLTVHIVRIIQTPTTEKEITVTIPEYVFTPDSETPKDGEHLHAIDPHVHIGYGNTVTTIGFTDVGSALPSSPQYQTSSVPDGPHNHAFTVPAHTFSFKVPVAGQIAFSELGAPKTYAWRAGHYKGSYELGDETKPTLPTDGETLEIYVLAGGGGGFAFNNTTNTNYIPLL